MAKKKKKDGASLSKKKQKKLILESKELAPVPSFAQSIGISDPLQAQKINSLLSSLSNISTYSDIGQTSFILNEFQKELGNANYVGKDYSGGWSMLGVPDVFGFRGFSSQFNQIFGSVFGVFAWISENYWPVLDSRNILYREILSDGYRLEGGTKQEREKARQICAQLNMKRLRCQIADHLKIYGNVFFEPIKNGLKGIKQLKPILPAYIRPIPTFDGQNIKEWQIQKGAYYKIYSRDSLLYTQFRPSAKNYDIGSPPLGAVLTETEGAISASEFSTAMFQKGGLWGIAVLLEGMQQGGPRGKGPSAYAQYLQAALQSNHSGNRAAYETVVFENAKDVKVMNTLSEMDAPFTRASDDAAKKTAHCLGIPHEMIGIITNANQQYHPSSMLDYSMKQLDKTIAEVLDITDTFINLKIFPLLGIKNVRIIASPRYNSITRVATQAGVDLGSLYNVVSIDEFREEFLGRPPLPNGLGNMALQKVQLDGGTKGGEGGAGAKPAQVIVPGPMPAIIQDIEEGSDVGSSEGIPG